MNVNWKEIHEKIGGYAEDWGERFEVVECAAHYGDLIDLDWMIHLSHLIEMPVSYDLYRHIDRHYDDGLDELTEEDIPAIMWLVNDYAMNGLITEDIWAGYDFRKYGDEYGFCGWHKRVLDGLEKGE